MISIHWHFFVGLPLGVVIGAVIGIFLTSSQGGGDDDYY